MEDIKAAAMKKGGIWKTMECHRMQEEDLEQVLELEKETFSMPWDRNSMKESMEDLENIYLVAKDGDCLAGYCGAWVVANEVQINNIAVKKEYRRQGVGEEMMQCLIKEAMIRHNTGITLEVRAGNRAAIALYEKCGFASAGVRKNFYDRPKEDAIIMWKYL